jgi:pimeloyl-ACP methyl ester carboxylesterase
VSRVENAGGEQVHVAEYGDERGDGPAVLLSSGLGGAWFDWLRTVRRLEDGQRVIAFDRPGLGLSPSGHAPPSLRREVRILEAFAERTRGPVVVVAHSMAAFHAEAFTRLHPDLVAGLVMVDPSFERRPRTLVRLTAALTPATKAFGALLGATRLARLIGPLGRRLVLRRTSRDGDTAPAELIRSVYGRGTVLGTVLAEEFAYREMAVDLDRLRGQRPFPAVPLVVLTALGDVRNPGKADEWTRAHAELAAMSPYGRQMVLRDSLHMVMMDRPDAVADAISEVLRPSSTVRDGA